MSAARRCSAFLPQLCASSSRGGAPGRAALSAAPGTVTEPPRPPNSGHPMGGSGSRLLVSVSRSLTSAALSQQHLHPHQTTVQDLDLDQDLDLPEGDPEQMLRECEAVLQRRPARPHRDLVDVRGPEPPPEHCPPLRVMQWNILAQALGEGKDSFVRCPLEALDWEERKFLILEEILTHRPDVLCLQEVDHYYDTFQPIMASLGYRGSFLPKPWSPCLDVEHNNGPDGCALFHRAARFELQSTAHLRLSALMLPTNQVAIAQTLRCRLTGRRLCVAVTHLKARHGWERLRSAQGADLLHSLRSIAEQREASPGAVPLVVCGDFNAEPSEDVYRRFSSSPLGLSSAYKLLSADGSTEPAYTTWKIRPSGESRCTLDYIWYSRHALSVDSVLALPTEEQIGPDRLPSYHYPSDHLSLLCDISFREAPPTLL